MQCSLKLSLEGRSATLQLLQSIARFLKQHEFLWRAHVVEFFQKRLWEQVDPDWWEDLTHSSIQDLLWLPSGKVQDTWCTSLKDFVQTAQSLALQRKPSGEPERIFPGLSKPMIRSVLSQGMTFKKQHEVEILSAVIDQVAEAVHATHVVDVGAGQGYLAQVLSFELGLPVVALDACAHNASVTSKRSERIKKYYMANARKAKEDCVHITGPQMVTFQVVSGSNQMDLQHFLSGVTSGMNSGQTVEENAFKSSMASQDKHLPEENDTSTNNVKGQHKHSFVLAGLHACGDLSARMIHRTFMMCEKVKAVVAIGCCYNLLSEGENGSPASDGILGFPLSKGVKRLGLSLGRRARDLACQSADRWRDVGPESAMQNFEQHALRAAFQLVLHQYYPDVAQMNPSIGRLGKARRRKQVRRPALVREAKGLSVEAGAPIRQTNFSHYEVNATAESAMQSNHQRSSQTQENYTKKERGESSTDIDLLSENIYTKKGPEKEQSISFAQCNQQEVEMQKAFIEFSDAAFERLGLQSGEQKDLCHIWRRIKPQMALVGPFWSLRAVLGPVLETYILLDRLLYLQESTCPSFNPQKDISVPRLVALFDPEVSPRNMAVIAMKH